MGSHSKVRRSMRKPWRRGKLRRTSRTVRRGGSRESRETRDNAGGRRMKGERRFPRCVGIASSSRLQPGIIRNDRDFTESIRTSLNRDRPVIRFPVAGARIPLSESTFGTTTIGAASRLTIHRRLDRIATGLRFVVQNKSPNTPHARDRPGRSQKGDMNPARRTALKGRRARTVWIRYSLPRHGLSR